MINKKGQLGATVTWIVAFTIIFFILMLYLIGAGVLAGTNKAHKFKAIYDEDSTVEGLTKQRKILKLFNSEVEFKGESAYLYDVILSIDESSSDEDRDIVYEKIASSLDKDNYYFFKSDLVTMGFVCGKSRSDNIVSPGSFFSDYSNYEIVLYGNGKSVDLSIYSWRAPRPC